MNKISPIYVAGHNGMVGSAIIRLLLDSGFSNIITRSSSVLDLRIQSEVEKFFLENKPEYVFIAAAKVGGILANNNYKADFIYDNLMIQSNLINACKKHNVIKSIFLGSSCIYPKLSKQPIKEEYLLSGFLEPTNEPYAIAKIAGLKMCESFYSQFNSEFISLMPTNLYGPNDNYDLQNSHVIPALIKKIYQAKSNKENHVTIWGSGNPKREFLHVEDLARACLFFIENVPAQNIYEQLNVSHINIGTGLDISIKDLAKLICGIIGFGGELIFDTEKPDGTPKKLLDISKANFLGWKPQILLEDGIKSTIKEFIANQG
jgi:GDP-L-fucose synthase